ncbi:SUMF1/EgtB/PvdO family nonheme iron enzyme [Neorhizobium huautlense]|uniref:SUMF1/EgtB/PvdO family nonheme iron enzyme n=1 Tax=Neorhizobium huautlense TaxID=67774 RepID=UPI000CF904C6|nr:SUMF1/EgtB/PvdO family nonheme iron enzyme [Neorhizobium huautlense]
MPWTKPSLSLFHTALPITLIAALSAGIFQQAGFFDVSAPQSAAYEPKSVVVPPRTYKYRSDGEFVKGTAAVDPPMKTVIASEGLTITKYQITASEYAACVLDGACAAADATPAGSANVPVTGVSFDDATDYARWLSRKTGEYWTLPSDQQLAQAAGKLFPDDALGLDPDSKNPALRWLADYEREARERSKRDPVPRPIGSFGENEYGLADFGGNVWEWTSTCHRRVHLYENGSVRNAEPICGVYVTVAGHRSPVSAFIRDPKGGGCSVGTPPDNLGFRLVKSTKWYAPFLAKFREKGWIA